MIQDQFYEYLYADTRLHVYVYRRILLDGSEDGAVKLVEKLCTPTGFTKDLSDELQGQGLAGLLPYIRLGTVSPLLVLGLLKLCGQAVPPVGVLCSSISICIFIRGWKRKVVGCHIDRCFIPIFGTTATA